MFRKTIILLDLVALLLSGIWIVFNVVRGISTADLVFSYLYSLVVMVAFILTLQDQRHRGEA